MYKRYVKRLFDIIFASILLIISLPIALILSLLIKLEDGGPIIFKHKRFGQNKKPFTIYKFRSMSVSAPKDCPTNDLYDAASYITKTGKFLRKLSLDELPQILNVLRGDMSLVGPRPVVLNETDLIAEREKYNANSVKPGITGWAQVHGRDELRIKEKAKMDGDYVKNFGILMDLKCLLFTLWAVLSVKGNKEGSESNSPKRFESDNPLMPALEEAED